MRRPAQGPVRGTRRPGGACGHRGPARLLAGCGSGRRLADHHLAPLTATTATTTPIGHRATPSVSSVLANRTPSNQTGIYNVELPTALIAPGQALFAANCSSCHGPEALGTRPGAQPPGTGGGDGRLLGVHRSDAPGQLQRAGHPQATPVQPPPDPGDRGLGAVPDPGRGSPDAGGQHQRCRPRVRRHPVHPQLRGLPHHHRRR